MASPVNNKPPLAIRRKIDVEMAKRGWKQQHLAAAVSRARNTVNRAINHGENQGTLALILQALGIRA